MVSDKLIDLLDPASAPIYKAYIDKSAAVLALTGAPRDPEKESFIVEKLIRIEQPEVDASKAAMERLMALSAAAKPDNRKRSLTCQTPTSTDKKCRTIGQWPSDPTA